MTKPVITVSRPALYLVLSAFCQGQEAILNLHAEMDNPGSSIAILINEYNENIIFRKTYGRSLTLVKKDES